MTATAETDRRQILKDSTRYLSSTILAQGVGLLRSLLLPVLLGPAQLGIWNLMNVIIGNCANAHLGILHGFNKKVPVIRTLGRTVELNELKDSVFWINLLLGLAAAAVLFVASNMAQPVYAPYSWIIAVVVVQQMIYVYYFSLLRADSRFDLVSAGIAGLSIFSTVLVLTLAYFSPDRLWGALFGLLAAYPFVLAYWYFKGGYRFTACMKLERIKDAFIVGFPLIVLGMLDMALLSMDRWIIALRLTETELGYYAMGIMASNLLSLVPVSVANVLYPRMLERFAATNDHGAVGGLLLNPVRAVSVFMIFLISAATIFVPMVIRLFLPKYVPSIPLVEILVPGAYFLAIASIAGNFVIAVNRQAILIKTQITAMVVSFLLDVIFLWMGFGIRGIAYGTICGYAVYGLGYLGFAAYLAKGNRGESLKYLAQLLLLFLVMAAGLGLTNYGFRGATNWSGQTLSGVARLAAMSGILLPFTWLLNRKSGMFSTVRMEISQWRSARIRGGE